MSFVESKKLISEGDIVFLYSGIKTTNVIQIKKNKISQIKFGAIYHNDLIGSEFGQRYKCSKGNTYVLAPTPELWSLNLPHRTQILYATDISLIISLLYLRPNFKVIEAGTGSGSLSHSIIRTIFPTGHLHTFDFHEERVKLANNEFKQHKLEQYVTCIHRDVCKEGFDLFDCADAIFLDLPTPWLAIPFAYKALKNQGARRICCFSPCIEQVQKTVETLRLNRFVDIETLECLNRPYEFKSYAIKSLNLNRMRLKCGNRVMNKDEEVNLKEDEVEEIEEEEEEEEEEKTNEDDVLNESVNKDLKLFENVKNYISPTPLRTIPGHTGFLTFATKL